MNFESFESNISNIFLDIFIDHILIFIHRLIYYIEYVYITSKFSELIIYADIFNKLKKNIHIIIFFAIILWN